jgi:hypothetical protein
MEAVTHLNKLPSSDANGLSTSVGASGQPSSSLHLYLISGSAEEISRYAGTTVERIVRNAHLLCDPLGTDGHIFTLIVGTSAEPR